MESEARAHGWRRDAIEASGALAVEVKRRRAAEAALEAVTRDRDYWRKLAIATLRPIR